MFLFWSISDNSEAQHFIYFHFLFPSAGRSFMLEFLCWSSKDIWFWCFPNCFGLFGHLLFGFRYPGEIFSDLREIRICEKIMDHDSDLLDAFWYHGGFFQTTAGVRSDHGRFIFWTFWSSFDFFGGFCLLLCLCIILTWNPIDYLYWPLLLVVHQRFYCLGISSLWL